MCACLCVRLIHVFYSQLKTSLLLPLVSQSGTRVAASVVAASVVAVVAR